MIRLATGADEAAVLAACRIVPCTGPLCEIHWHLWRQNHHMPHRFYWTDGGALLKISGKRATACGVPHSGEEAAEAADFLAFTGVGRLMSVGWWPPGWPLCESAAVLQRPAGLPAPTVAHPFFPEAFDPEPHVDEVLAVLESSDGRMQPEGVREGFWVDFQIRRNHGMAKVVGVRQNGMLAATAGAYAITEEAAYLACVETMPPFRQRGYASGLVARLCAELPGKAISLMCKEELLPFYRRLGFAETGERGYIAQNPAEML